MTTVPGLTPMQNDTSTGRKRLRDASTLDNGERMRVPGLKPQAQPTEIYHRPEQKPINHDLENLAAGLSSLNPALARFAAGMKKDEKDINEDALSARYGGKSAEEIRAALGSDPELQNKFAAKFVGNIASSKQGDADAQALDNWYNNDADKNGDVGKQFDEFVAKRIGESFAGNSAGAEKYMERMAGAKRSFMERHAKFLNEQGNVSRMQNTQDGFASILRQGVDTDASPEKIISSAGEFMRTNRAVMNVGYKEQMQYQLDAVRPLLNDMDASPDKRNKIYGAVEALLTGARKDPQTGIERRLIDAPDGIGEMAQKTLTEFRKKRDELNEKTLTREKSQWEYSAENEPQKVNPEEFIAWSRKNPGVYTPAAEAAILKRREEALDKAAKAAADYQAEQDARAAEADLTQKDYQQAKDGDFLNVKDATVFTKDYFLKGDGGATKKVSAETRRQNVVDAFSADIEFSKNQLVNSQKATSAQADDWARGQELAFYSRNGMIPREWKQEFQTGANQLVMSAAQASKEMPQGVLQAYERYKLLSSRAPNLLSEVADERTRTIFETAMVADGSPTEQLGGAAIYYANRDDQREAVAARKVREEVAKMANADWSDWLAGFFGGETPDNLGTLNDKVTKRATYIVQAQGVAPEVAIKRAVESVKDHYTLVNGYAIDTNDRRLPANFKPVVEKYLRNVVEHFGAEKLGVTSHSDLTLMPMRDGTFMLLNKRDPFGAMPIVSMPWNDGRERDLRFLDTEMIQSLSVLDRDLQERKAVREGEQRLQPLFVLPGTTLGVSRPNLSGYQPGEMKVIEQNIDRESPRQLEKLKTNVAAGVKVIKEAGQEGLERVVDALRPKESPFKPGIILRDSKRR
ncbi:hypothetical protein [Methylorubrum thiocyanatum]|uniref:hypothetical protein n=1 Tax=Methylorubrum thiocyanatum TaxID=47958 RepID=UPI00398C6CB9